MSSTQEREPLNPSLKRRVGRRHWRDMVHWFDPRLLLRTLLTVMIARAFATYADRREREAARPLDGPYRYDGTQELWLDYVADLGDGWNSTATIASLLAAPVLALDGEVLPHGRVLVMGGDQCYPAASREEYLHRLEAPYYSVLPHSQDDAPRDLFVLPGNHDWYDGLAAFARLFLQGRWFAGWRTSQSRSYFVLKLPQRWWFIAVDVQLDNDIDAPQLEYLRHATNEVAAGDRVVLVSSVPFWLEKSDSMLRRNLAFLERRLVAERGARVWLSLAGDLHHYQRYAIAGGPQRVTAGGGGAFMHGTAWHPDVLVEEDTVNPVRWVREKAFPSPARSRLMLWRLLAFPVFNPSFALFLGLALALLLWGIDAASHGIFFGSIAFNGGRSLGVLIETLPASPLLCAALVAWCWAFVAFEGPPEHWSAGWQRAVRLPLGMLHGLLHLTIGLLLIDAFAPSPSADPVDFFLHMALLAAVLAGACGILFGAWIFAGYQCIGAHRDTVFSACRIEDWKNFLRLHITEDGALTLYAIGVRRVCRRWIERVPQARGEAFVEPGDGITPSRRAELVDKVVIRP